MKKNIAGDLPAGIMANQEVRFNVKVALKYYRYLRAFCENAVDSIDWYINGQEIPANVQAIAKNRTETLTILEHIDRAIETYHELCEQEGETRPYEVIVRKYIDPKEGADGKGKPFTNEELAFIFEVNKRTIERDIKAANTKLSILFFGISGIKNKPTA